MLEWMITSLTSIIVGAVVIHKADSGILLPAPSADALSATLYGYFTQAIFRNRPVAI